MERQVTRGEGSQQWSTQEEVKYYLFVLYSLEHFTGGTCKKTRPFKDMSLFMVSRKPGQCKSHHQKKNLDENNVLSKLAKFIDDYYLDRCLEPAQATI